MQATVVVTSTSYSTKLKIFSFFAETGGIEYTAQKMQQYKNDALKILSTFPASEIKTGFEQLVNYVTERKY